MWLTIPDEGFICSILLCLIAFIIQGACRGLTVSCHEFVWNKVAKKYSIRLRSTCFQCNSRALFRNGNQKHHSCISESTVLPMPTALQAPTDHNACNDNPTPRIGGMVSGGQVMLQTALGIVIGQVRDVKARGWFDIGRAFAIQDMVERLGMEPTKVERFRSEIFGSQKVAERMTDVVGFELELVKGGNKVKIVLTLLIKFQIFGINILKL